MHLLYRNIFFLLTAALLFFYHTFAQAQVRPGLDDFYERTRSRTQGFEKCFGYCDGEYLLQLLLGGQVANPSTDELKPARAEGVRIGVDAGILKDTAFLLRTKAWGDLLYADETGDRFDEYVSATTLFLNTTEPGGLGVHLSADVVFASRTELEPEDFKEFQVKPYRMFDLELEVTPVGPKIDKEAFLALPVGYARRTRWNTAFNKNEVREIWSGAAAFRAFQKQKLHHYQLDAIRVTHVNWDFYDDEEKKVQMETDGWKFSFGYQRFSPDIDWLQLWLLFGWGWFKGDNEVNGFLTRIGAEIEPDEDYDIGFRFDRDYSLDPESRVFSQVYHFRLYSHIRIKSYLKTGLSYEYVDVERRGSLHAIAPEVIVQPFEKIGLEFGLRYRINVLDTHGVDGMPDDHRFNVSLDMLF